MLYSNNVIKNIGKNLRKDVKSKPDIEILTKWRAEHIYPMGTFVRTLRMKVSYSPKTKIGNVIVAQRLKRLPTILDKLNRQPTMDLSKMQDIAGVRTIFPKIEDVIKFVDIYKNQTKLKHERVDNDKYDYIKTPKNDGYRGVHLVYKYQNPESTKYPDHDRYNGTLVEIQFRSKLQHYWATSIETADLASKSGLKYGKGAKEWKTYFKLLSSMIALMEECDTINEHKNKSFEDLRNEFIALDNTKHLTATLNRFSSAINTSFDHPKFIKYVVLSIDPINDKVSVMGFENPDNANEYYDKLEAQESVNNTVLVSAGKLTQLKQAYPNYFADISNFIELIDNIKNHRQIDSI